MSFWVRKVKKDGYENTINNILDDKSKKILVYGAEKAFVDFVKVFPEFLKLNIVAIADEKFKKVTKFKGIKAIPTSEISNVDYDLIIVTKLQYEDAVETLEDNFHIEKEIKILAEDGNNERDFVEYLDDVNFEKNLLKLSKKLKNKKVMFYGGGIFFQTINRYYDLSKLNVVGLADKKYETDKETKEFLNFKTYAPDEIKTVNPDYVLVTMLKFVNMIEFLSSELLKSTKIKVIPLVKLPFFKLVKEIWES